MATVMYLMLVKGKQNEVVYGSVSGTPWALGKIPTVVRYGQVTGGDDGFTPPPGAAVTKGCGVAFPFAAVGFHWLSRLSASVLSPYLTRLRQCYFETFDVDWY